MVEFVPVVLKEILKNLKRYNKQYKNDKLHVGHLGFKGSSTPIFMSENLTTKGERCFHLARDFIVEYKFK